MPLEVAARCRRGAKPLLFTFAPPGRVQAGRSRGGPGAGASVESDDDLCVTRTVTAQLVARAFLTQTEAWTSGIPAGPVQLGRWTVTPGSGPAAVTVTA